MIVSRPSNYLLRSLHPKFVVHNWCPEWNILRTTVSLLQNDLKVKYFSDNKGKPLKTERVLPRLIYLQNPITWVINKLDFRMLRKAWDPEFDEEEFIRGTKKAVSVICCLISDNLWDNLKGLLTRQALGRLHRHVETTWSDQQRREVKITPEDIKLALPRRLHFQRIVEQKFVDVDMIFVAMKLRDSGAAAAGRSEIVTIEIIARFHRNYTEGQLPNWTVSLFKVSRFDLGA